MKYIFPKNYKYRPKILGYIDYVTAVFDIVFGIMLFLIIHLIFKKVSTQIYAFIILFLPLVLITVFFTRDENIIEIICYMFKFIKRRGIFVYGREEEKIEKNKNIFKRWTTPFRLRQAYTKKHMIFSNHAFLSMVFLAGLEPTSFA